jgi:hypothetical protein
MLIVATRRVTTCCFLKTTYALVSGLLDVRLVLEPCLLEEYHNEAPLLEQLINFIDSPFKWTMTSFMMANLFVGLFSHQFIPEKFRITFVFVP